VENMYCRHIHADCRYLIICKNDIEGVCLKEIFGEETLLKPEYTPEEIMKRLKYFRNK